MVYITPLMYFLILQFVNRLHAAVRLSAVLWCVFIFLWGQSFLTQDPDSYIAMPTGSAAVLAGVSRSPLNGGCAPDCRLSVLTQFQADFTDSRRGVLRRNRSVCPRMLKSRFRRFPASGRRLKSGPRRVFCSAADDARCCAADRGKALPHSVVLHSPFSCSYPQSLRNFR